MGAYSSPKLLNNDLEVKIKRKIIDPTLNALKKMGHPFKGFLYTGLMIKNNEPFLIEYNIRLGDPECQVLMMRLKTDFFDIIKAAVNNNLSSLKIEWSKDVSMTIVLCSKGYPGNYKSNSQIKNLNNITEDNKTRIFHAGTIERGNKIFSTGGRVLNVTVLEKNLLSCREKCIENLVKINWSDGFFRKDIGWREINKNESD